VEYRPNGIGESKRRRTGRVKEGYQGGTMKRMRQTIKAGKRGTKKYLEKYGSHLIYVRYYYDVKRLRRITTVELIIEEKKWVPAKIRPEKIVQVKVDWGEKEIAMKIKNQGGLWNKERRVWEIPFGKIKELGLQDRMVL
jgi:hypothetical protein